MDEEWTAGGLEGFQHRSTVTTLMGLVVAEASMDAFELLAEETRADVLRALAAHQRDSPGDPVLSFSELRERAGVADSGNFNYHLGKLDGRFVQNTGDGYALTPRGVRLAALAVAGFEDPEFGEPAPLGSDCPACGDPLAVAYDEGMVAVACERDHVFPRSFLRPPGADREPDDLARVASLLGRQTAERVAAGVCPVCDGRVDVSPRELDTEVVSVTYSGTCADCGTPVGVPPEFVAVTVPAVVAFWYDRGVDVADTPVWGLPLWDAATTTRDGDRVTVTLDCAGDRLAVTFDDGASVVAVDGPE
jgi:DNA-binding transcriptional ArsR family regulator